MASGDFFLPLADLEKEYLVNPFLPAPALDPQPEADHDALSRAHREKRLDTVGFYTRHMVTKQEAIAFHAFKVLRGLALSPPFSDVVEHHIYYGHWEKFLVASASPACDAMMSRTFRGHARKLYYALGAAPHRLYGLKELGVLDAMRLRYTNSKSLNDVCFCVWQWYAVGVYDRAPTLVGTMRAMAHLAARIAVANSDRHFKIAPIALSVKYLLRAVLSNDDVTSFDYIVKKLGVQHHVDVLIRGLGHPLQYTHYHDFLSATYNDAQYTQDAMRGFLLGPRCLQSALFKHTLTAVNFLPAIAPSTRAVFDRYVGAHTPKSIDDIIVYLVNRPLDEFAADVIDAWLRPAIQAGWVVGFKVGVLLFDWALRSGRIDLFWSLPAFSDVSAPVGLLRNCFVMWTDVPGAAPVVVNAAQLTLSLDAIADMDAARHLTEEITIGNEEGETVYSFRFHPLMRVLASADEWRALVEHRLFDNQALSTVWLLVALLRTVPRNVSGDSAACIVIAAIIDHIISGGYALAGFLLSQIATLLFARESPALFHRFVFGGDMVKFIVDLRARESSLGAAEMRQLATETIQIANFDRAWRVVLDLGKKQAMVTPAFETGDAAAQAVAILRVFVELRGPSRDKCFLLTLADAEVLTRDAIAAFASEDAPVRFERFSTPMTRCLAEFATMLADYIYGEPN